MLLALETANEGCSVALYDGHTVIAQQYDARSREQTRVILPMIEALLSQHQLSLAQLQAIAFSRGPGSFSGVRVNAAVTQGLAWAHDLPVVPVSSLQALAQAAYRLTGATRVLSVIDARMNELYSAAYCLDARQLMQPVLDNPVQPALLASTPGLHEQLCGYDQVSWPFGPEPGPVLLAGNGAGLVQWPDQLSVKPGCSIVRNPDIMPMSEDIAVLGYALWQQGQALSAAQALPVYLRDNAWKTLAEQGSRQVI